MTIAAEAYALCTVSELQDQIGNIQTLDQDRAQDAINVASIYARKFTGRDFKPTLYWKEKACADGGIIQLSQFPLISLDPTAIKTGMTQIYSAKTTTSSGTTTTIICTGLTEASDYWNGADIAYEGAANVWQRSRVIDWDFATKTLTLDAALPLDAASASGKNIRLTMLDGTGYSALQITDIERVDYDSGEIFLTSEFDSLLVENYYAGYDPIPGDVADAVMQIALAIMNPSRSKDLGAKRSEGAVFPPLGTTINLPEDAKATLMRYRAPLLDFLG